MSIFEKFLIRISAKSTKLLKKGTNQDSDPININIGEGAIVGDIQIWKEKEKNWWINIAKILKQLQKLI